MEKLPEVPVTLKRLDAYEDMKNLIISDQVKTSLKELDIKEIKNEAALTIVKSNTQHLKKVIKLVADVRLKSTRSLDDKKKEYIKLEKMFVEPIEKVINNVSTVVANFLNEKEKIEQKRLADLRTIQMKKEMFTSSLLKLVNDFFKDLNKAVKSKDMSDLSALFNDYLKQGTNDNAYGRLVKEYPDNVEDLDMAKNYMLVAGKNARAYIKDIDDLKVVKEKIKNIRESLEENYNISLEDVGEAEEEEINQIRSSTKSAMKGVYYKIDYEVIDFDKVPKEFLKTVVDHDKVEFFKKEHQEAIGKNKKSIPGIKFIVETKIRG